LTILLFVPYLIHIHMQNIYIIYLLYYTDCRHNTYYILLYIIILTYTTHSITYSTHYTYNIYYIYCT